MYVFEHSKEKCSSRKMRNAAIVSMGTEEVREMNVHLSEYEIRDTGQFRYICCG